jgi:hypothetical protein
MLVARVEVGGETIGCLGSGEFSKVIYHYTAEELCESVVGFPASETPEQFAQMLEEGPYGARVQVTGGPAGTAPFLITTTDRWVPAPIVITPITYLVGAIEYTFGSASSRVTSEGSGRLVLTATNLGDAPVDGEAEAVRIEDVLPEGVFAYGVEAVGGAGGTPGLAYAPGHGGPVDCAVHSGVRERVVCGFESELAPYEAIEVEIYVALESAPPAGQLGTVTVSGANANSAQATQTIRASDEPVPFGIERFAMQAEEEGGGRTDQAGAHPFQLTTTLQLNSSGASGSHQHGGEPRVAQPALPRNVRVTFPAGLVGTAKPVPQCDMATFLTLAVELTNACPKESAVGVASATVIEPKAVPLARLPVPIFNLPPAHGEPARFGFMVAGAPVLIDTSVDPEDEYKITGEVHNVTQVVEYLSSTLTLWGTPGDPRHDSARGWECTYVGVTSITGAECAPPAVREETPFLRMPTACNSSLEYQAEIEPWNVPVGSQVDEASDTSPPLLGCNRVPFDPAISASPTSRLASNPSGLDFELRLPDPGFSNPTGIAGAQPKKIEVALPEGMTINPSQAEGLATCSPQQYSRERFDSKPGEGCPEASKIGSVTSHTPIFDETLEGSLYVATPYENPFGSLIALYVLARAPERGVLVKQPLEVSTDPRTGRLVTIADHAPPAPYEDFRLHFREGARSPLITPPGCGSFTTTAKFVPYSAQSPANPDPAEVIERKAVFAIDRGVTGGACPSGPAPFHPDFSAGTQSNQAATYSPFDMRITRADGEQDITRLSAVLPPGVVGKIAGLGRCPDAGIARAASRSGPHGGAEERSDPSCPADSRIGTTYAGAGVGSQLIYVPGSLYLAGPYNGDPLSVVAITPALAGPFDAGTVVVRQALTVNPTSGEVEVDGSASDPIPHILKGIPLNLRELQVKVDRPDFTLNATSCAEEQARAEIFGGGTVLAPTPDTPVALQARYQAAGCRALGFKPKLAIKLSGGTRRGAHPSLRALVTPRKGDANFSRAVVALPHSAFLDQGHIRTICTRVQFAAPPGDGAHCPKGSVYGHAKAWTPLVEGPAEGPVFMRSSNHNLPDLVLALKGPPSAAVHIVLDARIDSVHGGIRTSFTHIPDLPVSRFLLQMRGGHKGLIVNSRNLCFKPKRNRADARLAGQNGRREHSRPVVRATRCAKHRVKRHRRHGRSRSA